MLEGNKCCGENKSRARPQGSVGGGQVDAAVTGVVREVVNIKETAVSPQTRVITVGTGRRRQTEEVLQDVGMARSRKHAMGSRKGAGAERKRRGTPSF